MKSTEAKLGRVFIIRLEDGDILHECVEAFAKEKGIKAAKVMALGGVDKGSKLVVGPKEGRVEKLEIMIHEIEEVYEATGVGTIFPNKDGKPVLHMHLACGRKDKNVTGCVRAGVKAWHVLEIIIQELTNTNSARLLDAKSGFELLEPK